MVIFLICLTPSRKFWEGVFFVCGLKMALCGIEWIIEFEFTSDEVNHVDEIMNIPIRPSSSFGQLNFTIGRQ